MQMPPAWYKINDIIPVSTMILLLRPLYKILERTHVSRIREEDPFARRGWQAFHDLNDDEWHHYYRGIELEKAYTMEWGNLHQNLMGMIPGWETYKVGHPSGCDIGSIDGTIVAEVKNNIRTMNSDSKKKVMEKLRRQHAMGKTTFLIIVNGHVKRRMINGVQIISGMEWYTERTGRSSFYMDLLHITDHIFTQYKTYTDLQRIISSMEE